jgi:hypothetical protein
VKITACLAYFDEPEAFLDRLVGSLAGVADELVALDGRWEGFPGRETHSPVEQAAALVRAGHQYGVAVLVYGAARIVPWESQVEKRSHLMRLGALTDAHWLLVVDADEVVTGCDRAGLDEALAATSLDVATVLCDNQAGTVDDGRPNGPKPVRRLFRADAGVTVERAHNGYRTVDGRWLLGDTAHVPLDRALDCTAFLQTRHERFARGDERNARALAYRRHRAQEWAAA